MKNENKRTLREDWQLIRRGLKVCSQISPHYFPLEVLWTTASCLTPYFGLYMSALLLNELAGTCDPNRLLFLACLTVGVSFLLSLMSRILQSRRNIQSNCLWHQYYAYMFDHQNNLQFEHLENADVTLLKERIGNHVTSFGGGLFTIRWIFPSLLNNLLNILLSASLTLSMFRTAADKHFTGALALINSPLSALLLLALLFFNAYFSSRISNIQTQKVREATDELAASNIIVNTYLHMQGPDMTIFDLHRSVMDYFEKKELRPNWCKKCQKYETKYGSLALLLNAALRIAVFLFTAAKAYIGIFGLGSFILYQGTVKKFIRAVSEAASDISRLRHNNIYLEDFFRYLDLPNDMYKGSLAVEKRDDIDYEIEFRDVSFKYPRTETWALRHVNMKFKIGDKLAIVGENGSGKTTFIKLLCRLYDPTEGKILLNGIDITRYRYEEYMSLFSVVFQDYSLFGFSLAENVAASNNIDVEKVHDCLIRAELGEKLASLEKGIHTNIGRDYENEGVDFSGGELQKIVLARALYKDAPFVILDEPTAALDPLAEAAVYENFNRIVQNKTAVFISHRLSSCRFCDAVAVFDQGHLVQQGSHDVLAADAEGKYSQLWNAQAQYYKK